MEEKLLSKIYNVARKYKDPMSGKAFDQDNKDINIACSNGNISLSIDIEAKYKEKYNLLIVELKKDILVLEGVLSVNIVLTGTNKLKTNQINEKKFKINAKNIIAIASGKGGVGKSTFAVNYAVALKKLGYEVGILDADIYGPSVPRMMGVSEKPKMNNEKKLIPIDSYGVKCMSIGFLIEPDTPAIWRGPMVMKALEQMFNGVVWGDLDYLIIDLPPGTGDAQITLAQSSKINGAIIISTPQDVALIDARKGFNMFNKVGVSVIGIVENMSYFICNECNKRHEIFSNGGAKKEAEKLQINFLGELPININLRIKSDEGEPVCTSNDNSDLANLYFSIAKKIHEKIN